MLIVNVNDDFLTQMNIESENMKVDYIKVNGVRVTDDYANTLPGVIDVYFKENIIKTSNGLSNKISLTEEEFYKWFNCEVVTYCYMGVDDSEFDDDDFDFGHEGDYLFNVPLAWLVQKLNEDTCYRTKSKKINNFNDLLYWNMSYTHEEGYKIYLDAVSDDVIIGDTVIKNCDDCKSRKSI